MNMEIKWEYFFGGHSNGGRYFDRYYKAEINGIRVEKHANNKGVKFSIGNMDKAKVKYKTERELLEAVAESQPDHYHLPLEGGGHATFPAPPSKETIEAVKVAVKLAKRLKKP